MSEDLVCLSELSIGQKCIIRSFTDESIKLKLMEMGCLPGESVTVERVAPFGDPIAVRISGSLLGLRKDEAATILTSPV